MEEQVTCRRCKGTKIMKNWDPANEVYITKDCWVCDGEGTVDKSMYEA